MIETSSTFRAPSLLSPRTANYVAALIRQGDNFDYFRWLQKVREEESQAKQIPATFTSGKIIAPEIDPPIGTTDCRGLMSRSLLNIAKRSLLRLMLSCVGLASKHAAG